MMRLIGYIAKSKMRYFLLVIALFGAILCGPAKAQTVPDADIIRILTNRFKHILHDSGINGVGRDVQTCYDVAWLKKTDPAPLRKCMLYDAAAYRLDTGMHYAMSM